MAGTFPIGGVVDPKSFPFLLSDLHRNGATGSLKVEGPTYQKALYFRSGRILFGSSNDPRDQLGAILIEEGRITPEQLEDVNSKVGPGNPLAKVLAETGFVSQRELSDAARAKVERILSDLIAYTSGSFEFEDGVLPKGAVDLKLSTERLILTAVRRITDRGFVLRHLDGLDVVLRPTADLAALRTELEPETGGLLAQLDGLSTLKEAAGRTRLDDFEAAKVGCALLFLGVIERADARGGEVLDLADTAREAFEGEDWTATASAGADNPPPPVERPAGEDSILGMGWASVEAQGSRESGQPAAITDRAEAPAPALVEDEPDAPAARDPAPPVWTVTSAPEPPLLAAAPTEPTPAPTWSPPARKTTPVAPRRPSKADLAAVDALLDSRALEGPLAPLERTTETRWTPPARSVQARRETGVVPRRALVLAAVATLAVGSAAAWMLVRRPEAAAARNPMAPASAAAALATPSPTPRQIVAAVPPPQPTPTAVAPALHSPSAPPATAPAGPANSEAALALARQMMRQGQLQPAARRFQAGLRAEPEGSLSIQLFVACSPETVHKAVANAEGPELFILPVNYKGRDCFRLCWGVYGSAAAAAEAVRTLPEYFVRGGATPRVMSASELLR